MCYFVVYLYKYRKRTTDGDKVITMPEEIFRLIDDNSNKITSLNKSTNSVSLKTEKYLSKIFDTFSNGFSNLTDYLSSIKKIAEERTAEIDRYRDGYDFCKFKVFIKSIIRVIDQIDVKLSECDESKSENIYEAMEDARDDLIILLDNNNIEQVKPEVGNKYSPTSLEYKVVKRKAAPSVEYEMTINEVVKAGYQLNISQNQTKIIREAEVVIYSNIAGMGASDE
jgi:molecular chaperone GrpE (heat shock protein)